MEPKDTIQTALDTGITFDKPVTFTTSGSIGDNGVMLYDG